MHYLRLPCPAKLSRPALPPRWTRQPAPPPAPVLGSLTGRGRPIPHFVTRIGEQPDVVADTRFSPDADPTDSANGGSRSACLVLGPAIATPRPACGDRAPARSTPHRPDPRRAGGQRASRRLPSCRIGWGRRNSSSCSACSSPPPAASAPKFVDRSRRNDRVHPLTSEHGPDPDLGAAGVWDGMTTSHRPPAAPGTRAETIRRREHARASPVPERGRTRPGCSAGPRS